MELNFDFEEPQPRYKCCGGMNAHRADCTSRNNGEGVSQDAQPEPVEATEADAICGVVGQLHDPHTQLLEQGDVVEVIVKAG